MALSPANFHLKDLMSDISWEACLRNMERTTRATLLPRHIAAFIMISLLKKIRLTVIVILNSSCLPIVHLNYNLFDEVRTAIKNFFACSRQLS